MNRCTRRPQPDRWFTALAGALSMAMSLSAAAGAASPAAAGVQVRDAWVRPAVQGQSGTGGYLTLETREPVTLLGFRSPVASETELHEMRMSGDVMQMRALPSLPMKAGAVLKLGPGGQHLMLMGLKRALAVGDVVPLTLKFKTAKGQPFEVQTQASVQVKAPEAAASAASSATQQGH